MKNTEYDTLNQNITATSTDKLSVAGMSKAVLSKPGRHITNLYHLASYDVIEIFYEMKWPGLIRRNKVLKICVIDQLIRNDI